MYTNILFLTLREETIYITINLSKGSISIISFYE